MIDIINKYKSGDLDCNNHESFFSILIKGLIVSLNALIKSDNKSVAHFILHAGDEQMYLENKGQDASIEPTQISNEDYIYNTIPRCIITPNGIDIIPDQITNPYTRGNFQIDLDDNIYTISAEFRRMPIKLTVDLKYYLNTYTELLNIIQELITNCTFIRNFNIVYLGQNIICSYKLPENFSGEHLMEIDETLTDTRYKTLNLSLEIETNIPIFSNGSTMSTDKYIKHHQYNIHIGDQKITNEL